MVLKKHSKVIGWDDGPFEFGEREMVPLVGVVTRGGDQVDGVLKTEVEVDGLDATTTLITTINGSKHSQELQLIILDGITFGGFNVVDIKKLANETDIPVLAVTRKKFDLQAIKKALGNLANFERRWEAVLNAGDSDYAKVRGSKIYFQTASLSVEEAKQAISITTTYSSLPEPVRLADMIARAIVSGES
ncbi:DUF99 family protein [Candidatus Bipolaricaulota bacterium]|nr:DUF99 family protein [Candidatus Bipolaricaulota bacterium]